MRIVCSVKISFISFEIVVLVLLREGKCMVGTSSIRLCENQHKKTRMFPLQLLKENYFCVIAGKMLHEVKHRVIGTE